MEISWYRCIQKIASKYMKNENIALKDMEYLNRVRQSLGISFF